MAEVKVSREINFLFVFSVHPSSLMKKKFRKQTVLLILNATHS